MAISTTILAADLAFAVADLPTTLSGGFLTGGSGSVVMGDPTAADRLTMMGNFSDRSVQFVIPSASCSRAPSVGEAVSAGGTTYNVAQVSTSPDGISYTLTCEEATS